MIPEIRDFIARSDFCQPAVRELAAMLPSDDAALDALIGDLVMHGHDDEFIWTTIAALSCGRPVQARHLARGVVLLSDKWWIGSFACHMVGEKSGPLLEAVRHSQLPTTGHISTSLFLAAHFHFEQGGEKPLPAQLISAARTAARNKGNEIYDRGMLQMVGLLGGDSVLTTMMHASVGYKENTPQSAGSDKAARALGEHMLRVWHGAPIDLVPLEPRKVLADGNTMRRAVARVGRNEQCPCGSGKKYKRCCADKDGELLEHPTSYAGVTTMELRANPERFLNLADLVSMPGHEAARCDPGKIDPSVREAYLACLCRGKLFDECVAAMELFGYSEALEEAWDNISIRVAQAQRKDLVERLMKLRPNLPKQRQGAVELLLSGEDPEKLVALLSEEVLFLLDPQMRSSQLVGFAQTLLQSRLAALGIFVARGMIPLLPQADAAALLELVLQTRDKLCLDPEDPIAEVIDQRFLQARDGASKEAAALREAQQQFLAKVQEVQRFKENLERMEKEIVRREQAAPSAPAANASAPAPAADEAGMTELRQKVSDLRTALTERHNERNDLRRELQQAHADLDALRQKTAAASEHAGDEPDHEEHLLLPQEAGGNQPVRTIEFPKDFRDKLASLPKSVARGALTMLGRLAAGEPAAFVGAVRLKACPDITRQRIGIDFRLLFRLLPDRVQVVDLIPRQDLERRIKTLTA